MNLKDIKEKLGCLVPREDAPDNFLLSSHEKALCDCEVLEIIEYTERLEKQNELMRSTLEFYANESNWSASYPIDAELARETLERINNKWN